MKSFNHHPVSAFVAACVVVVACVAVSPARAESVMHFNQHVTVSELGDATFKIHMKFNASQFQQWQQRYGMNPALLKREMGKFLSPYDVTAFKLDKDDMEREVTVTIAASGMARYRGDGQYELEVPKNWRMVNKDGNELKFSFLESIGQGTTIQHHVTALLPATATDISDPVPATSDLNIVKYQLPVQAEPATFLYAGVAAAVLGLLAVVVSFVLPKGGA